LVGGILSSDLNFGVEVLLNPRNLHEDWGNNDFFKFGIEVNFVEDAHNKLSTLF